MSKKGNEKEQALDLAISQIEKQFGKGAIMKLGEGSTKLAVEAIPTGSLSLDVALGVGGIPRGSPGLLCHHVTVPVGTVVMSDDVICGFLPLCQVTAC